MFQSINDGPGGGLGGSESSLAFTPTSVTANAAVLTSDAITLPFGTRGVIIHLYDNGVGDTLTADVACESKFTTGATGWSAAAISATFISVASST